MTINFHANVAAPFGVKHREQLDNNRSIQDRAIQDKEVQKESSVASAVAKNLPIDDDASREQIVEQEASSTIQYSSNQEEPFINRFEWVYQQANLIGAALRGADSSFSSAQGSSTLSSSTVSSSTVSSSALGSSTLSSHIQGADFSAANFQGVDGQDFDAQAAANQEKGFATLYPDGFPSYSGKLAQYIYQHIGGVFDPRIVNGAQLVGVDEIV